MHAALFSNEWPSSAAPAYLAAAAEGWREVGGRNCAAIPLWDATLRWGAALGMRNKHYRCQAAQSMAHRTADMPSTQRLRRSCLTPERGSTTAPVVHSSVAMHDERQVAGSI